MTIDSIKPTNLNECLTIKEHSIPALSSQEHLPFWEKEWIAPRLKEQLFSQPAFEQEPNQEVLRTYLIIDSYIYNKVKGISNLDMITDVEIKCLFTGQATENMKQTAPYLIDMTLSDDAWQDKSKVPDFHKVFFNNMWGHNAGIFIRSTAVFNDVWCHFRKFTQIQDEQGKWYFFRFWDPQTAISWYRFINGRQELAGKWFFSNSFIMARCCFEGSTVREDGLVSFVTASPNFQPSTKERERNNFPP